MATLGVQSATRSSNDALLGPPTRDNFPIGSVGWLVPLADTFDSYTRIFHPIYTPGLPGNWHDMASYFGTVWHRQAQLRNLSKGQAFAVTGSLGGWASPPFLETLREMVGNLKLLVGFCTIESDPALHFDDGSSMTDALLWSNGFRDYRIFWTTMQSLISSAPGAQPSIIVSAGHEFCAASDTDLDSSILASSQSVQSGILLSPSIEALFISVTASLQHDADKVNG